MTYNCNPAMPDVSMKAFDPPMPSSPRYPVEKLHKVKVFASAAEFTAAMGNQPPAFDESFRFDWGDPLTTGGVTKSWVDTTPYESGKSPTDIVKYAYLAFVNHQPVVRMMSMTVLQAATYNMPGQHKFRPYGVLPTPAYFVEPLTNNIKGVDPTQIILLADAEALAKEINTDLGLTVKVVEGEYPYENVGISWENDPRRPYDLLFANGQTSDAAKIYAQRNGKGIGTPGKFTATTDGKASWVPDTDDTVAGSCPVPIRLPVAGKEELVGSALFAVEVRRVDLTFVGATEFEKFVVSGFTDLRQAIADLAVTK